MKQVFDAIIVGAGFSGLQTLYKLREAGFNVKVYESGSDLGGTWYWTRYPGARVDSDHQIYQFIDNELWKDFQWSERFPGWQEIQKYFKYVDGRLNLSKDIEFNTRVTAATFDNSRNQWLVQTDTGSTISAPHLILGTGIAEKRYTPPFPGLESFRGEYYHSGTWPEEEVDFKGKRVAVIGTGASGVQIIQEIAPEVSHLTVYQRTPNLALPMKQYSAADEDKWKRSDQDQYAIFEQMRTTFIGLNVDFVPKNAVDATPEEREALYEELYRVGGFAFWVGTYHDVFFSKEANDYSYQFWCKKTRARITDPVKKDLLAPLEAPHAFGIKRPSLEQCYYERFNQDNVDIINVRESPIVRIAPDGIETEKEGIIPVDILVFATGYDCITGGILCIDIKNDKGEALQDKWKNGTSTYLGMTTAGFPNLYFLYGPQSTNGFTNGPSSANLQSTWMTNLLVHMRESKKCKIDATLEAEKAWCKLVQSKWDASLFPGAESWYQGANIPGKPREALAYFGGLADYTKKLGDCAQNNYEGFTLS